MNDTSNIPIDTIQQFMIDVFVKLGTPPADAQTCSDVLIASDLRGIQSHGVGRLKYYYDRIQRGQHRTVTQMEVIKETETTAVVDGHHGMGHLISYRSMEMAIAKAQRYGLGAVAVRNGTHFGIAGYYPLMAAEQGLMGLAVTNARPSIMPTFGGEPMLGTNPIAFAAPSDMDYPFWYDGATSIAQRGKIEVAARAEKPVPEGWVATDQGKAMTDPDEILAGMEEGTAGLLPLGGAGELFAGYKGYSLATIVEILSASLSEGAFMKDLLGFEADGSQRPYRVGHFFLAINIEHFVPVEISKAITGGIMRSLQQAHKEPGQDRIYVAGEKEHEKQALIREQGIPVNKSLRQELQTMRDELEISGYCDYF